MMRPLSKHWTRVWIGTSDGNHAEIQIPFTDLTAIRLLDEVVLPTMVAHGYSRDVVLQAMREILEDEGDSA